MDIKKLPIIGIIFGTTLILSSIILFVLNNQNDIEGNSFEQSIKYANVNDLELEETEIDKSIDSFPTIESDNEEEEDEKEYFIKESGWIPNWGFDLGMESLENNRGIIDTVNPVLYSVDSRGNVVSRGVSNANIERLLDYCRNNSIRVIPTIGSFDYDAMRTAFSSNESYKGHINTIVSEIDRYGFDGIDLDYEMINIDQKEFFLNFLRDLKNELDSRNKVLSVTVFPQWENGIYTDHQDTRAVQDYSVIGDIADEVRIMTYDYTLQTSKEPGPIAPINWMRDVLDYAIKYIPKEKIWLGIHLYGYQWSRDRTVAFTYTTTESAIINSGINNIFREDIGEGYAEFTCDGDFLCKAYFQTPRGVQIRRDIAREYGIAGVSYWRLGGEVDILK